MTDQWTENLRCHACKNTSIVSLSQSDFDQTPTVLSITDGFKVLQTEYGPDSVARPATSRRRFDDPKLRHLRAGLAWMSMRVNRVTLTARPSLPVFPKKQTFSGSF